MAYAEETDSETEKPPIPLEEIAAEALDNYKLYKESYSEQEKRENEDLSWQDPENMWDPKEREGRGSTTVGGLAVAKRPTLAIPMHKQPISLVLNQAQAAHFGVNVHPISEQATDDTAEIQQDLYRAIERDSNASVVRFSAFKRATWCGRGWYRVNVTYDESTSDPFDLKIVFERIVYQGAVFIDPSASAPDFSDAQWGGVTGWMPRDKFKATYPKADLSKMSPGSTDAGFYKIVPDWVRGKGESESYQVGEYFRKHYDTEEVSFGGRTRKSVKCRLWRYVVAPGGDGLQVVEYGEWNGPDIPLIPCVADELEVYDDKRRFFGMVRPARDACRIYNYAGSQLVQRVGVEPLAPFVIGASQIDGYEDIWGQANLRAFSYLPYNDKADITGERQPPPKRTEVSSSAMGPAMMLLQESRSMIQAATATPDVALGVRDSSYRSGKAEEKLQRQSEAAKTNFLENFVSITLRYEAKVVLGMMANVYDRPGRVAHVIDMQGVTRSVMLNSKFVKDQKTQSPIRVNDQAIPMVRNPEDGSWAADEQAQPLQQTPKSYDLSKGFYGVSVDVGKATSTRMEEGSEQLSGFMEADPELSTILAPLFLQFQDWPGSKEAAELAKRFRDMKYPQMNEAKDGEETPDQLKAKLAAAQTQIQQGGQQLQELQQQIQTDQAKQQAMVEKARIEAESAERLEAMRIASEERKAQMDNEARIQVAQISAGAKIDVEQLASVVAIALDKSKAEQAAFNRRHEAQLGHESAEHEKEMALQSQNAPEKSETEEGAEGVE